MRWIVRCEDGRVRHEQPFDTMAEAQGFAEWGHCCTNSHRFERVVDVEELTEGIKVQYVVVDGLDGMTFWRDGKGFFTEASAIDFARRRSAERHPGVPGFTAHALGPALEVQS